MDQPIQWLTALPPSTLVVLWRAAPPLRKSRWGGRGARATLKETLLLPGLVVKGLSPQGLSWWFLPALSSPADRR